MPSPSCPQCDDHRRALAAVHDDLAAMTFNGRNGIVRLGQLFDGITAIRTMIREHLKTAAQDD